MKKDVLASLLEQDFEQRRKTLRLLVLCMAVGVTGSYLPDAYYGLWTNFLYLPILYLYLLVVWLLMPLNIDVAANIFLAVGALCTAYFAFMIGDEINVQYIFFVIILLVPTVVSIRKRFQVIFQILFCLSLFQLLVFTDYEISFIRRIYIEPQQLKVIGTVNIVLCSVLFPFAAYLILKSYNKVYIDLIESQVVLHQKNAELVKTNKELNNFVYSVSHDLRAPISSVLGLINISKKETDLKQLQYYEELKEQSLKKLDSFIKDILDYSRNTRLEINNSNINFKHRIEQLLQQFEYLPEANGIDIDIYIHQKVEFYTDEYRLGIILNNLFSNAFRYADKGKTKSYLKIGVIVSLEKATLKITDNGTGIRQEHLGKIFDMFYRATEISKGSGLGLYILKETLEKIQGEIKVISIHRKGTAFQISLPNLKKL